MSAEPDDQEQVHPRSSSDGEGKRGEGGAKKDGGDGKPQEVRPPPRAARSSRRPRSSGGGRISDSKLKEQLAQALSLPSVPFALSGDSYCAAVLAQGADNLAAELVALGKSYPGVRSWLELLAKPGAFGGLVFALAGMVIPVAVHHGMMPRAALTFLGQLVELPDIGQHPAPAGAGERQQAPAPRFVAPAEGPAAEQPPPPEPVPAEHVGREVPGTAGPFAGMAGPSPGQALAHQAPAGASPPVPSGPTEGGAMFPAHDQPPA